MNTRSKSPAPSSTVEDYAKVIYSFTEWQPRPITSSQLAARLGVANSSVSEMVRKLKELGLVDHQPYSAVELTDAGRRLALSMVRRHRILETYLVQELGYRWDEVHDEAELLEHTVSDLLIERMSLRLGDPRRDPHGDPIPDANGHVDVPRARVLAELDEGSGGAITRISDANPDILRHLTDENIALDDVVTLLERKPFGGPLVVRIGTGGDARTVDLGVELAGALWIGQAEAPR